MKSKNLKDILIKMESLKPKDQFYVTTNQKDIGNIEFFVTRQTIVDQDYFIINIYGGVRPLVISFDDIYSDYHKSYFWNTKKIERFFDDWGKLIYIGEIF